MGRLTLEEFRARMNKVLEESEVNDRLDDWINDGYFDIAGARRHDNLEEVSTTTLAEGEFYISLPDDLIFVKGLWNITEDQWEQILQVEPEDLFSRDESEEGAPEVWGGETNHLRLHPQADEEYTLRLYYYKEPEPLSSPSDKSVLPTQWDRAIHMLAVRHALLDKGAIEASDRWLNQAVRYVQGREAVRNRGQWSEHERGLDIATDRSHLR